MALGITATPLDYELGLVLSWEQQGVSSYYKDVKHVLSYAPDAHMKMPFNAIVRIFFLLVIFLIGYSKKKYLHQNEISYSLYPLLLPKARC